MAGGGLPVTRSRTTHFIKCRTDRRKAVTNGGYDPIPASDFSNLLLGGADQGGPPTVGRPPTLPPKWCDDAEEAQEYLYNGRQSLIALQKAQKKRLLNVFQDDSAPDKDVEALSKEVANCIRNCDKCIHQVKTRPSDPYRGESVSVEDQEHRLNTQRKLAAELRELSKQCRQAQRDYLDEIKRRQQGGKPSAPSPSSAAPPQAGAGNEAQTGEDIHPDTDGQLLVGGLTADTDLDRAEEFAAKRSGEVAQIAQSFTELHQLFQELGVMVIDQGTVLDRIDCNMEKMVQSSLKANKMVEKTAGKKKAHDKRACWGMVILASINAILLLILLCKYKIKYGWSFQGMFTFIFFLVGLCAGVYFVVKYKPEWIHKACPMCAACCLPSSTNPNAPAEGRWQRWTSSAKSAVGLGGAGSGSPMGGASAGMQAAGYVHRVAGPQAAASAGAYVAQAASQLR